MCISQRWHHLYGISPPPPPPLLNPPPPPPLLKPPPPDKMLHSLAKGELQPSVPALCPFFSDIFDLWSSSPTSTSSPRAAIASLCLPYRKEFQKYFLSGKINRFKVFASNPNLPSKQKKRLLRSETQTSTCQITTPDHTTPKNLVLSQTCLLSTFRSWLL